MELPDNNLRYTLQSSLANLTELEVLDLSGNKLRGQIGAWMGNLSNLKELNLSDNGYLDSGSNSYIRLSGSIPSELGSLSSLA